MKGDDDILFNPWGAQEYMKTLNETKPGIWGAVLGPGQPAVKDPSNRYADLTWPEKKYPAYVSGGGNIMNWKAMMVIQVRDTQLFVLLNKLYLTKLVLNYFLMFFNLLTPTILLVNFTHGVHFICDLRN